MGLGNLLIQNKKEIAEDWFNLLVDTYPAETAPFYKSQKDPFENPVGATCRSGLAAVFDELIGSMDAQVITSFLDPVIRVRAVQTMFTASQAIGFIFLLKKVVRQRLKKEIESHQLYADLLLFESRIDELALIGFNIFTGCREKIAELRSSELKDRTFRAFERAGLVVADPEQPRTL